VRDELCSPCDWPWWRPVIRFRGRGKSEDGIESRWTYRAEPEGDGTRLTLGLEYQVPERTLSIVPTGAAAEAMRKAEADRAVQNLKIILDR
jgi:hypothetical protein